MEGLAKLGKPGSTILTHFLLVSRELGGQVLPRASESGRA